MSRHVTVVAALAGVVFAGSLVLSPVCVSAAAPVDVITLEGVISPVTLRLVETGTPNADNRTKRDWPNGYPPEWDEPGTLLDPKHNKPMPVRKGIATPSSTSRFTPHSPGRSSTP